jgi:hypothetical protein
MDCRTFQKNLEDYLEGGLDFPGRFGMERHAKQCYLCGKEVTGAQTLSELAKKLERVGSPGNFENDVLARIHSQSEGPWISRLFPVDSLRMTWLSWRRLALVGTAAIAGLSLYLVLETGRLNNRSSVQSGARDPSTSSSPNGKSIPSLVVSDPSRTIEIPAPELAPTKVSSGRANHRYSAEPGDSDYLEYVVPGPAGRQFIMRLPKTIRMGPGQPSEEYFIRNVSH